MITVNLLKFSQHQVTGFILVQQLPNIPLNDLEKCWSSEEYYPPGLLLLSQVLSYDQNWSPDNAIGQGRVMTPECCVTSIKPGDGVILLHCLGQSLNIHVHYLTTKGPDQVDSLQYAKAGLRACWALILSTQWWVMEALRKWCLTLYFTRLDSRAEAAICSQIWIALSLFVS